MVYRAATCGSTPLCVAGRGLGFFLFPYDEHIAWSFSSIVLTSSCSIISWACCLLRRSSLTTKKERSGPPARPWVYKTGAIIVLAISKSTSLKACFFIFAHRSRGSGEYKSGPFSGSVSPGSKGSSSDGYSTALTPRGLEHCDLEAGKEDVTPLPLLPLPFLLVLS